MSEAPLSFDEFFQDEYPRLFATMCLTTGSRHEAEEIAQDAFVRLLERWDRVGVLAEPAGFLYRTAMNPVPTTLPSSANPRSIADPVGGRRRRVRDDR